MNDNYRIVISIIRGTAAGRALSLMAQGLTVGADTLERATELLDKYLDCAHPLLCSADEGTCFGMVSVLNTVAGKVEAQEVLMGRGTVVRESKGANGRLASK